MAVIGRRDLWDETIVPPVPPVAIPDDAITGQSLVIDMFQTPPIPGTLWAMKMGASLNALLPDEKIQINIAIKLLGSATLQSRIIVRPVPAPDLPSGFPDWGFIAMMTDFSGPAVVLLRFINGGFEFLGSAGLPSFDERLQLTSDDSGNLVRFHAERWNGAGFDSLFYGQYADMLPMQGKSSDPIVIIAGSDDQGLPPIAGDKIMFDDIIIDSAAVIPP